MFRRTLLSALAFGVLISQPVAAQSRRPVTPEDYFLFRSAGDPRLSPDGGTVAYTETMIDRKENRRVTSIWLTPAAGDAAPRLLATGEGSVSSPRWSGDGKSIAFIATRRALQDSLNTQFPRAQLWIIPVTGGEARRISNLKNGVSGCEWSPDGSRFACIGRTGPSDNWPAGVDRPDTRHYNRSNYKFNDTGYFDDKRGHIWIIDAATGASRQLTSGDDWNDSDPQWSPDGNRIAFVSDRTGKELDDEGNTDIWVIPASGGAIAKISDHEGNDRMPRWSPDGSTIAYAGQVRQNDPSLLYLASSTGGQSSRLAVEGLDITPTDLTWSNSRTLMFGSGVRGEYHIYRIDLSAHNLTQVTTGARALRNLNVNAAKQSMTFLVNDFKHLDDVYVADLTAANERKLTALNDSLWAGLLLADVERFSYKGADDVGIDGFVVKPVNFQANRKYPVILSIHGGPASMYGVDWFHEFQVYASRGWGVVFTNPRGSTGYGHAFARGIAGEWGGKDYVDIMQGLDAALAANSWMDSTRLGVTGGSYGGFMTNWIVGHTNRFKAAVTLRSISNFISDEGTRDGAYGHKDDFGGVLFDNFDFYWDRSPLKYAKNVRTPTLILHSDNDYRVPIEQGEQWFRALRHFGAPAEMVLFPRENHNLTRTGEPKHLVESLNWQVYWFRKYLDRDATALPPNQLPKPKGV